MLAADPRSSHRRYAAPAVAMAAAAAIAVAPVATSMGAVTAPSLPPIVQDLGGAASAVANWATAMGLKFVTDPVTGLTKLVEDQLATAGTVAGAAGDAGKAFFDYLGNNLFDNLEKIQADLAAGKVGDAWTTFATTITGAILTPAISLLPAMDAIGGQEILLPALLPREPYEGTNRWTEYGDSLFRLQDRKGTDMLLGPTHEEIFALTVKGEYNSYKDLPVILYQIQTKYRDEERPRAGILRGREFVMKDSYSFDTTDEGLSEAYAKHRAAYQKIFARLDVEHVIVSATSGAMGGSASEEFLAVSPVGEDTYVHSTESDYAANVEAVVTPAPPAIPLDGLPAAQVYDTPDAPTIDTLVAWANQGADGASVLGREVTAGDTLKNVMVKTRAPGGDWELLGIGVPGDREVDFKRLEASLEPTEVALLEAEDFAKYPFLVKGYIGPKALLANEVRYLVDPRVVEGTAWITGADAKGQHVVNLTAGRDFVAEGTIEAAEVRDCDASPDGKGVLKSARGIEIGHIFQLGRKYTDAFEVDVLGENGKPVRLTQGSYGVGVSRLVAVIAEQQHDDKGLRWPKGIAPFDVHVVIANKDEGAWSGAESLAAELDAAGLQVVLDDRKASPGIKFKDSELIGVPVVVVVGRGWADGVVELRDRLTGESREIPVADAAAEIVAAAR